MATKQDEKAIDDIYQNFGHGAFRHEIAEKLGKIVKSVARTHRKGKLTITIEVAPDDGDSMSISTSVVESMPVTKRRESRFYDKQDGLTTSLKKSSGVTSI